MNRLEFWLVDGLKLLGGLKFARGVFGSSYGAIGSSQQIVGNVIAIIHSIRALQVQDGVHGVILFEEYFAEQDKGSCRVWLQQQRLLKGLLRSHIVAATGVGVAEPVVDAALKGVAGAFLFKLGDSFIDVFVGECNLAQEHVRQRQLRIEFDGLLCELLRYGTVVATQ